MTDQTRTEEAKLCASCGNFYAVKYTEKHKRVCPAVVANTFRQYREQHGGSHVGLEGRLDGLDADVKRIDTDYDGLFKRVDSIEDSPKTSTPAASGIPITGEDDTDSSDPDEPDVEPATLPTAAAIFGQPGTPA